MQVGLAAFPDRDFLRRTAPILEGLVDYIELSPETLWGRPEVGDFFADVQQASGLPFVAHGLGLSLGTPGPPDRAHLDRIRSDHERFDFAWYSEHLGFWRAGDRAVGLALPLPHTDEAVDVVCSHLAAMAEVVPVVAFENWAGFFSVSPAQHDPAFFGAIQRRSGARMLLDLHNVQTHAANLGCDPDAYVDALDLSGVVEIHLAGGSHSDPAWLPSRRVFRLDSHDGPVTDWQWSTLARILPRCTGLRGVTLERLPRGLSDAQVPGLVAEFERLRGLLAGVEAASMPASDQEALGGGPALDAFERAVLAGLDGEEVPGIDTDGLRITSLVVQKLRFQRLATDPRVAAWFERDPRGFLEAFRAYRRAVPPRFVFAADELRAFWSQHGDGP